MQLTDFKTHDVSRFPEARCVATFRRKIARSEMSYSFLETA
jgi:hypothetical protein